MSLPARPLSSASIELTPTHVHIADLTIEEPRLAEWLAALAPEDRPDALVDIVRLGLALRLNNQVEQLNEALKHTADRTVEELKAKMALQIADLENKLAIARGDLAKVLEASVAGDNSQLKVTMGKAFEEVRQGLQQARTDLVQALDPRHTESVGAQLEQRLKEYWQGFTAQTITPKLDAVSQTVAKLEATLAAQNRLKEERQKGTAKGTAYEVDLLDAIQTFALPATMLIRRVADEKGLNGTKDGDLVIEYNGTVLVVLECKDAKGSKLDQLDSAMVGRQAPVGIMAHKHPGGPTLHLPQGSVRIAGDTKLLLVWDPETDEPALLTAVIGLAVLLGQHLTTAEDEAPSDVEGPDLERAQAVLDVLVEKLDLAGDIVRQFELITGNADKGVKAVEKMKKELLRQFTDLAAALGLELTP